MSELKNKKRVLLMMVALIVACLAAGFIVGHAWGKVTADHWWTKKYDGFQGFGIQPDDKLIVNPGMEHEYGVRMGWSTSTACDCGDSKICLVRP